MPRGGWVKPETDQRLSDHISLGVLTRVFPPELVDRIVAEVVTAVVNLWVQRARPAVSAAHGVV